ncbi:MAG: hypothetical protein HY303_07820, partial [Candidatus Wallbacteria bacterium]|nr:hypothetical protein [Candidatus Wallbacteria bacterium]
MPHTKIPPTATIRFEIAVPPGTPKDADIYLAGDAPALGNWDEAGHKLHPEEPHRYSATVELPRDKAVHYKLTRGSWTTVESDAFGRDVPNRVAHIRGYETIHLRVAGWKDHHLQPTGKQPLAGNVSLTTVNSRLLRGERRMWVYTPPESAGPGPYPVLLCLDGLNCFHWGRFHDSMPVSWGLDVIADNLILAGKMQPVILAAVANSRRRASEYTPWRDQYHRIGGLARKTYTAFRDEFLPHLEKNFPARAEAATNGILGSSLGGLFSFWSALQEPSIFSRAAVVSPAFFWGQWTIRQFLLTRRVRSGLRMWMDVGTNEIVAAA